MTAFSAAVTGPPLKIIVAISGCSDDFSTVTVDVACSSELNDQRCFIWYMTKTFKVSHTGLIGEPHVHVKISHCLCYYYFTYPLSSQKILKIDNKVAYQRALL